MLEVASLCAAYGDLPALNDISFKLEKGEALVLLGRNGVGKTTLLKSLIGILKPSAGHIYLNGDDVTGWKPHRRTRAGIGYVPQGRGIFSNLTVEENLLTGLRGRSDGRTSIPDDVLELFPILRERLKQPAGTFSGASSSSSPWLGHCVAIRRCCCWTSHRRESSRRSFSRLGRSCNNSAGVWASPSSLSSKISSWRARRLLGAS